MLKSFTRILCLVLLLCVTLGGCSGEDEIYRSWERSGEAAPAYKEQKKQTAEQTKKKNYDKRVALTLDDGPHNEYTKRIVDELAKYGYHATFFVVGNRVDGTAYNGKSALKYAAEKGNEIGIHGYTHEEYYDDCSDSVYAKELSNTEKAITDVLPKYSVSLMRPVGGKITDARIKSCEYSVIMWSVDPEDWRYSSTADDKKEQNVETIVNNVMSSVKDGSIILMHDIYGNTADAVEIILKRLDEEGYEVVTVSELIGKNISAGKRYSQG